MNAAVEAVFMHLPNFLQTEYVRAEIATRVAQSKGNFEEAALQSALELLDRFGRRVRRPKLARLKGALNRRRDFLDREYDCFWRS
jgi:hypothetical protein